MLFKMGNNPFENQNLVVRIGDQYYNWKAACPIVMSLLLYGRSFPSEITEEMGKCIWSGQKKEKNLELTEQTNLPPESITNEQTKQSSWWPFGAQGSNEQPIIQNADANGNSDQDLGTAVATAFGATEMTESEPKEIELKPTPEVKIEADVEGADNEVQLINNDQVDNKSQQFINEQEVVEMNFSPELISDSLKTDQSASVEIDIEPKTDDNKEVAIDIEKVSSGAQTGESLQNTPPRAPRVNVNASSSSEASHMDDVLKRENIFGKFKKTLRLSSDSIVSSFKMLRT